MPNKTDIPTMLTVGFEPIPGYRLKNFLGRGQFGEVWRATSPGGTHVALKFLNVRERQGRKEFRAIQKVKGIRHPHLVLTYALWLLDESMQVIDDAAFDNNHSLMNDTFGATLHRMPVQQADKQKPFMLVIATVLCEQNLMERLREYNQKGERGIPYHELIEYIEDAAKAIDFLNSPRHELGDGPMAIHHCDIKPENIMVLGDLAVVGDFGVARILSSGMDSRTTSMAGSVAYAAPETFGNRIESTSDQYSLAITYYELRTGKLPFPEESQAQVIRDKLAGNLDFSDVPQAESKVLQRAMSVSPSNRFPTARAFVDALRIAGGGTPQRSRSLPMPVKLAIVGAILLSLISTAAWYFKLGRFQVAQETDKPKTGTVNEGAGGGYQGSTGSGAGDYDRNDQKVSQTEPKVTQPGKEKLLGEVKINLNSGLVDNVVNAGELESEKKLTVDPKPIPLSKPIVVSSRGNGSHTELAAAIADSKSGDTIRILPGTYREKLIITHPITLIGDGVEGSVKVASSTESCVQIRNSSKVRIENVSFDIKSSKSSAIDIESGSLELVRCPILTSSLDSLCGLTLRGKGIVTLENCKFRCASGKAVVAEKGASITLRDCTFEFLGNSSTSAQRVAVQGNGANGIIQRCSISGSCNVGIDWMECSDQALKIEACHLKNCDVGIQTRSCKDVVIRGDSEKPCTVFEAKLGLNFQESKVELSRINVNEIKGLKTVAMRITDQSSVNCSESEFQGYECGILVRNSSILVDRVAITSARYAGIFVDNSKVGGKGMVLTKIAKYGLVSYSKGSSVVLNSMDIRGGPNERDKAIPIYAASGRIEFKSGEIQDCLCGIFVDPKREVIGSELPDKRILSELIGSAETGAASRDPLSNPVEIAAELLTLKNCENTWIFNGPGASRIKQLKCDLPTTKQSPVLAYNKSLHRSGTDLSDFEVLEEKKNP